ncbi:MAG: Rieske 2Fe-2S domain-containing protein [Nitrospirae bacterium]|nr:MAG: Rieske 2Fe-2S domain-containing protein [Nitrospirota bacterium]
MPEFVKVAGAGDVAPGSGVVAEVKGQSVAVFNVDGTYYVIDNTCVHRGGPLGEGELEGDTVTCPWHGWQYDVKSGKSINNPSACVKSYQVMVEGSDVKILL